MMANNQNQNIIDQLKEIVSNGTLDKSTSYKIMDDIKNTSKGMLAGGLIGGAVSSTGDLGVHYAERKKYKKNLNYAKLKLDIEKEERNKKIEEVSDALIKEREERNKQLEELNEELKKEQEERKKQLEELNEELKNKLYDCDRQINQLENIIPMYKKKLSKMEKQYSDALNALASFNVIDDNGVNKEIKVEKIIIPDEEEPYTEHLKITKKISTQKPSKNDTLTISDSVAYEQDEIQTINVDINPNEYDNENLDMLIEKDKDFAGKKEEFKELINMYKNYITFKQTYNMYLEEIDDLIREKDIISSSYIEEISNLKNKPFKTQDKIMDFLCETKPDGSTKCHHSQYGKPLEHQKVLDDLYHKPFENQKALDEAKKYKPNLVMFASVPILGAAIGSVIGGINRHKAYTSSSNQHYKPSLNFSSNGIVCHYLLIPLDNRSIEIDESLKTLGQARDALKNEGRSFIEIDDSVDQIHIVGNNEQAQKIRQLLNMNNEETMLTKDNDKYKLLSAALYSFIPNDLNEDINKKYKIIKDYLGEVINDNNIDNINNINNIEENQEVNANTNENEINNNINNINNIEENQGVNANTNENEINNNINNINNIEENQGVNANTNENEINNNIVIDIDDNIPNSKDNIINDNKNEKKLRNTSNKLNINIINDITNNQNNIDYTTNSVDNILENRANIYTIKVNNNSNSNTNTKDNKNKKKKNSKCEIF